jgi:hypothetical protein
VSLAVAQLAATVELPRHPPPASATTIDRVCHLLLSLHRRARLTVRRPVMLVAPPEAGRRR